MLQLPAPKGERPDGSARRDGADPPSPRGREGIRRRVAGWLAAASMIIGVAFFYYESKTIRWASPDFSYLILPSLAVVLGLAAVVLILVWHGRLRWILEALLGVAAGGISVCVGVRAIENAWKTGHWEDCINFNASNLSLAVELYAHFNYGELPSADRNICAALAVFMGDAPDTDTARSSGWRCPKDSFGPRDRYKEWCSYAPNASVEERDEVVGAFSSNSRLSSKYADLAPDTIVFIEMWTPPNVVPGHPGFLLKFTDPARSMVEPGKELCAIRSYRTPRPVVFDRDGRLVDCGNYLFLRAFIGKRRREMYHSGHINAGLSGGRTGTYRLQDLIKTPRPIDNPLWTRAPD